jgi:hypothetical protein
MTATAIIRTWIARGTLTLGGVDFYVDAETKEEARLKLEEGKFKDYDINSAELVEWSPGAIELNETVKVVLPLPPLPFPDP